MVENKEWLLIALASPEYADDFIELYKGVKNDSTQFQTERERKDTTDMADIKILIVCQMLSYTDTR